MKFSQLKRINVERCNAAFHPFEEWKPQDWALAIAGEAGELCNKVKKRFLRGEPLPDKEILDEIADVVIYCDLLASRMGADLEQLIIDKFNEVSRKRGVDIFLQ